MNILRSLLYTALGVTAFPVMAVSQDNSKQVIWHSDSSYADHYWAKGNPVKIITVDGLSVTVSLERGSDLTRIRTLIINESNNRIEVIPRRFLLANTEKSSIRSREYKDPEGIVKGIKRKAGIYAAIVAVGADMDVREEETVTNVSLQTYGKSANGSNRVYTNGSVVTTTTSPDERARERAAQQADRYMFDAEVSSEGILRSALYNQTLFPNEQVFGVVHFSKDNKGKSFMLTVPIGNLKLYFPFHFD